jgi:hypothetical protein
MRSTLSLKKNVQLSSRLHSRFHETSTFKLHDLCFTVYFRGSDGELHHEWHDYFAEASHEWHFTFEGFVQLRNILDFGRYSGGVSIWADNAFRNYGCFYAVWNFSKHINAPVELNFFAVHHGFSLCDTHFGIELESKNFDETFAANLFKNPNISGKYLLNFAIQQLPFLIISQIESFRRISSLSMKEASNLIQIFILYPTKQCFVEKTQTIKSGLK